MGKRSAARPKANCHSWSVEQLGYKPSGSANHAGAAQRPASPIRPSWAVICIGHEPVWLGRIVCKELGPPTQAQLSECLGRTKALLARANQGSTSPLAYSLVQCNPNGLRVWPKGMLAKPKTQPSTPQTKSIGQKCTQVDFMLVGLTHSLIGLWAQILDINSNSLGPKFPHYGHVISPLSYH